MHQILKQTFEYLLTSDEIASTFVFAQKGLDYFLKLMLAEEDAAQQTSLVGEATDDELVEFLKARGRKESDDEEKAEVIGHLDRSIQQADFLTNEFARTMTLVDSNIEKVKELVSNMDWSVNKKGYRQRLVFQKFGPEHNNEIWLYFKLNRVVEIKEIQIGITNFWTVDSEVYVEPSSIIVEVGMDENKTTSLCSLQKLDDKGFANFGSTIYGLNLYAFNKQSSSDNLPDLIQKNF